MFLFYSWVEFKEHQFLTSSIPELLVISHPKQQTKAKSAGFASVFALYLAPLMAGQHSIQKRRVFFGGSSRSETLL